MPRQISSLTLAEARNIIAAGERKAAELGVPYNQNINHEKVVIFGGGAPVKLGDAVIGAVGASGGTVDQDVKVVKAALAAFESAR